MYRSGRDADDEQETEANETIRSDTCEIAKDGKSPGGLASS